MSSNAEDGVELKEALDLSEAGIAKLYRQNQQNAQRAKLFLTFCTYLALYCVLATFSLVTMASLPPKLLTFLTDRNHIVELVTPHRNPPVTDRQAIHWARDKVCDLLSLHFKKYPQQITRSKNYFVGDGWTQYQQSLVENQVIETIREEGLIITAINQETPRLLQKYLLDGKMNWRLEMPILQTIQGASDTPTTVRKVVSVSVEETRRDESIEGLKIRVFGLIE